MDQVDNPLRARWRRCQWSRHARPRRKNTLPPVQTPMLPIDPGEAAAHAPGIDVDLIGADKLPRFARDRREVNNFSRLRCPYDEIPVLEHLEAFIIATDLLP